MFETAVVICVFAYLIVKEIVWYCKEIDLIDRCIPRSPEEKNKQTIKTIVQEQIDKIRPAKFRKKKTKVEKPEETPVSKDLPPW